MSFTDAQYAYDMMSEPDYDEEEYDNDDFNEPDEPEEDLNAECAW